MSNNIEKRIENLEERVSALEKILHSPSFSEKNNKKKNSNIREFLNGKKPTTDLDRILALAVYHDKFVKSIFNKKDISDLIKEAKMKKPSNISDTISKNVAKGHFQEDGKGDDRKKQWYVTETGISLVENNFNNEKDT